MIDTRAFKISKNLLIFKCEAMILQINLKITQIYARELIRGKWAGGGTNGYVRQYQTARHLP